MLKRTTWIWAAGCFAWLLDGTISLARHRLGNSELAYTLAALFALAWLFYRNQSRK